MKIFSLFNNRLPKNQIAWCIGIPFSKDTFFQCYDNVEGSDFIDSLEFKYGTNNKDVLWEKYKSTADIIQRTVKYLQDKNVTIIKLSSINDLLGVFSYPVIIITAHHHRYIDCFDFLGNTISIEDVVDSIPQGYNGTIDISSCFSGSFQMQWKKKKINATYIAANTESSIELRMFIYEHIVRYMVSHSNKGYLYSLEVILNRIKKTASKKEGKRNDVFLGGRLLSQNPKGKSANVFAPSEIVRGDDMLIQVYVFENQQHGMVLLDAGKADRGTLERSHIPLNFNIKKGDMVTMSLNLLNLPDQKQEKTIVWQNVTSKVCFFVSVPVTYEKKKIFAEIVLRVNNIVLGELDFVTDVVRNYSTERNATDVTPIQYRRIFISYSHKDSEVASAIAEGYRALGTVDYFFDRHSLAPGELYEKKIFQYIDSSDLFILCWSKNAEASEWVNKERQRAFNAALTDPPRLRMYPINIIPYATPPDDMQKWFHFTDYNAT